MDPVSAGLAIANVVTGIADAGKRRTIEGNLMLLSEKEKIALAEQMARAQNKNEQATILINAVLAARNAAADRQQKAATVKWVLIGVAGLVTLGIVAWYLKK